MNARPGGGGGNSSGGGAIGRLGGSVGTLLEGVELWVVVTDAPREGSHPPARSWCGERRTVGARVCRRGAWVAAATAAEAPGGERPAPTAVAE